MFIEYAFISIAFLTLLGSFRIIAGPTAWDRLLGLNILSSKIVMLIVLFALMTDESYLLDIAIVYALLGFIGNIFIAQFIQGKGKV